MTSPWLIWNLVTFGTVAQTSGEAKQMFQLYGRLPPVAPAGVHGVGDLWSALHDAVRNLLLVAQSNFRYAAVEEWRPPRMANWLAGITAAYAAIVAICAFALRRRQAPERAGLRALGRNVGAAIGLFFAAHFLVYTFQIGSYYNWYFLPPVLVVCLAQGLSLGFLSSFGRGWGWAFALAHVVLLAAVSYTFTAGGRPDRAAAMVRQHRRQAARGRVHRRACELPGQGRRQNTMLPGRVTRHRALIGPAATSEPIPELSNRDRESRVEPASKCGHHL